MDAVHPEQILNVLRRARWIMLAAGEKMVVVDREPDIKEIIRTSTVLYDIDLLINDLTKKSLTK